MSSKPAGAEPVEALERHRVGDDERAHAVEIGARPRHDVAAGLARMLEAMR
jgi:hypothetical protein